MLKKLPAVLAVFLLLSAALLLPSLAARHGDVDGSGKITIQDARLALRGAVGLEALDDTAKYAADANADGKLSAADARLILRASIALVNLEDKHIYHLSIQFSDGSLRPVRKCVVCGHITEELSDPPEEEPEEPEKPEKPSQPDPGDADLSGKYSSPITVNGKKLYLGLKVSSVEQILGRHTKESYNFNKTVAYSFTSDYNNYVLMFARNSRAVGYYVCAKNFSCGGVADDYVPSQNYKNLPDGGIVQFFTDKNDQGKIYAMLLRDSSVSPALDNEGNCFAITSKQIFDMTNALRARYGLPAYSWHQAASEIAEEHSKDMAKYNYFDHMGRDGKDPWDRAQAKGLSFYIYAENIAAGNSAPYATFDQWVNSAPHRTSLLGSYDHLGVGGAYNAASNYGYYWTQNFLS